MCWIGINTIVACVGLELKMGCVFTSCFRGQMNYYFVEPGKDTLHIGKSCNGWYFLMQIYPGINNWDDWQDYIIQHRSGRIVNETEVEHSLDELTELVEDRAGVFQQTSLDVFLQVECQEIEYDSTCHLFRTHSNIYKKQWEGPWECVDFEFS